MKVVSSVGRAACLPDSTGRDLQHHFEDFHKSTVEKPCFFLSPMRDINI